MANIQAMISQAVQEAVRNIVVPAAEANNIHAAAAPQMPKAKAARPAQMPKAVAMAPPPPPGGDDDWHDEDEGDEGEGEEEDGDFEEDEEIPDLVPDDFSERTEDDLYKERALEGLECPAVPTDYFSAKAWRTSWLMQVSAIDRSGRGVLMRWAKRAFRLLGSVDQVMTWLENLPLTFPRLESYIGNLIIQKLAGSKHINSKVPLQVTNYINACIGDDEHESATPPRGRTLMAMLVLKYRLDRDRANVVNQVHLADIQLASFRHADVREIGARLPVLQRH